jgi:putative molybdopterin biosynthesis protein
VLLDFELAKRGIAPESIQGYNHEEYTHLAVAAAIKSGVADGGMGLRSAALALGLDFISVGWERYDFVIPSEHWAHPGIQALIKTLANSAFQAALAAQPGYAPQPMGQLQYEQ